MILFNVMKSHILLASVSACAPFVTSFHHLDRVSMRNRELPREGRHPRKARSALGPPLAAQASHLCIISVVCQKKKFGSVVTTERFPFAEC